MSAITGIFYRDGRKVDPELIEKMNDRLSHRGPDGSAVWCEGNVALGHQMLWTTPESLHEKLPFHDEKSGLVITADARIDNRKELSDELGIKDKEDVSDSYFILKAYEKWGEKCPEYLLGDFAFAIWDENEEKLFCARDHMGVKPFYYYLYEDGFFFATEMKALFVVSDVPYELNELKIALYFTDERNMPFYKDIFSLKAAYSMVISKNKYTTKRYWKIDPYSKIEMESDEDYYNKFLEIFEEAVKCRLRTAFPIGFDLSGGLDSSSIVCMTKRILNENNPYSLDIITFSTIFDDFPKSDERYYINKVIEMGGIKPNFVKCDDINLLNDIENILWYQDQPFPHPFLTMLSYMMKKRHEKSIRIHLSGEGGDYIVSRGAGYFMELAATFRWKTLINEIKYFSKRYGKNPYVLFAKTVIFPLFPKYIQKHIISIKMFIYKRLNPEIIKFKDTDSFLNSEFAKRVNINNFPEEKIWEPSKWACYAKKYHYNSIFRYHIQESLEMIDRNAGSHTIESRYPYFDKRLIEFCYAIPTKMKFRHGWDRFIVRASMSNILPEEIQWRQRKSNLELVLKKNLLLYGGKGIENIIYNNEIIDEYIDLKHIKKVFEKYRNDNSISFIQLVRLLRVSVLYQWLSLYKESVKYTDKKKVS